MARVLVVDDEPNTVSALKGLLEEDGYDVDGFTRPQEAVAALTQESYDMVLTDLEMPQVKGDALVRVARQHHPTACIFMHSARSDAPPVQEACHVFTKPLDYDEVVRAVGACPARTGPGFHGECRMKRK